LRRWFGHDPARWDEFERRYRVELDEPERNRLVQALAERATHGAVTLIYGARDTLHNEAVVLCAVVSDARADVPDDLMVRRRGQNDREEEDRQHDLHDQRGQLPVVRQRRAEVSGGAEERAQQQRGRDGAGQLG